MAYKYSKGSVNRGDIYNEDDTQGNTYLDWSEDALGIVTSGSTTLVVSASAVGIGTASPDYTLDVAGTVGIDEYIYHNGDDDTYIQFEDDTITLAAGGRAFIKLEEASQDKVIINHGALDIDLKVGGENNANLIRTVASDDRVGIGTGTPTSTLDVSGSLSAKITSITGTSNTIGATYTVLMGADDGACTAQLPAAADCTGRIHVFKRLGSAACTIQSSGSEKIEDSTDDLSLENLHDTYTIQCDGTEWWILSE